MCDFRYVFTHIDLLGKGVILDHNLKDFMEKYYKKDEDLQEDYNLNNNLENKFNIEDVKLLIKLYDRNGFD